jgi:broad-specificity NMP kinase
MTAGQEPTIILITGIQAVGKSTVAQLLAEQLPRSVHVRGDLFRRMVVSGRADMTPDPSAEAIAQLRLRYKLTAATCDAYFREGFTVVAQDVILGEHLREIVGHITSRPLLVVVLTAAPEVIRAREEGRGKKAYGTWAPEVLDQILRHETPRLGMWLDTTGHRPAEAVSDILARAWTEAKIP